MIRYLNRVHWGGATAALLLATLAPPVLADIKVTIEAPGVQASKVANVETMNFNAPVYQTGSFTKLETKIGTYTAPGRGLAIVAPKGGNADYGGASETGLPNPVQTQYVAVGAQSGQTEMRLQLNSAMNYFGMYWMAGDVGNKLAFYLGNQLLANFNVGDVIDFISGNRSYYGNPNNGRNAKEPYVYLNFFGTKDVAFDRVVFSNSSTGSGYESDNHSVALLTPPGPSSGTPIDVAPVPEPSTVAGALLGAAALIAHLRSRRRKNA